MNPDSAKAAGLTSTVTFPRGNLAPEGSVIKSTAIDPSVVDADGVYRLTGPARVFVRESDAIQTLKGQGETEMKPGDIMVLCCRGPQGPEWKKYINSQQHSNIYRLENISH